MRRLFVGLIALLTFSTGAAHDLADRMNEVLPSVAYIRVESFNALEKVDPVTKFTTTIRVPSNPIIGTGFIIDDNNVVTNYHVVAFAIQHNTNINITFENTNKEYPAKVLGYDKIADIALLEIPGQHPSVEILNCTDLRMGVTVFSISHFYGIGWSGTQGTVSSNNRRDVRYPYINNLQLQLLQGSGSSGGPVFNENGKVIALNRSIVSMFPRDTVRGKSMLSMVGYPIRGDTIIESIAAIRRDTIVTYLDLGASLIEFGKDSQFHLNYVGNEIDYPIGIMVLNVDRGVKTTLLPTDIIISIDDHKFTDPINLFDWLNNQKKYRAGDVINVQVYRDAKIINIAVPITMAGL